MAPLLGTSGTVEQVDSDGDVRVKGKCWNPALVERVGSGSGTGGGGKTLPAGCAARRPDAQGPHTCGACGGAFRKCFGAYGSRTRGGTWSQSAAAGLGDFPEAPNTQWCCQACENAGAGAFTSGGGALTSGGGRLKVGERVKLTPNFSSFGDASGGPLKPGDVGKLIQDDQDSKPFKVAFNGATWYFAEGALCRAT
jgi:hypothetical protein